MLQKVNKEKVLFLFLLVILVFLSLFPRSVEVLNGNPVFGSDQGRDYLIAKQIIVDHKLTLIGAEIGSGSAFIQGLFQGPFYYYLLAIAFFFTSGNPSGAVFVMWFFSILSIAFTYYFGKKLFGVFFGLITAILVAMSPEFITQARFAWAPYPETIFILLSFYFTYLFFEKNRLKILLAAFFAGFVYNFEFAVSLPLCLALFIYSIYIFRRQLIYYVYIFLGFILAFSPLFLFELRHKFIGLRGTVSYLTSHQAGVVSYYSSQIALIWDHWQSFLYNVSNTFPSSGLFPPLLILVSVILLSGYFLAKEKNINFRNFIVYLLSLIPVNFFVFYFLKNTVWDYYLTSLSLVYIFLIVYIIYSSFKHKANKIFWLVTIFIIFMTLFSIGSAVKTSIYDYKDYGGTAKLKGKTDAIDYIYKDAKGKPFGLLVFSPPVYTYPYDYLVWWFGEKKYHYLPYKDKKGTFYLLIEEDPSKPWSYQGWLQTVIKSGRVVWTRTLPSGFIIQKRFN